MRRLRRSGCRCGGGAVLERHPAVHLLNNAGVPARGTFLRVEPAVIRRAIEVNYLGGVWCTRAFLPGLEAAAARDGRADIVNLVSMAGTAAFAPAGAYAASKHAQLAFSRFVRGAARQRHPRPHRAAGVRRDGGFPQKNVLRSRLLRWFVLSPDEVAEGVLKAVERASAR